ncbi:MAG: GGDEF domain-containing protein [Pseudomonadota bacterium]|nr:GGDEF domain-containing protein [Pseudomonadota bacterium]
MNSLPVAAFEPSQLPTPRQIVLRVVRMAADPDVSAESLGTVIAADPAFTAELLRLVNSPFYGLKVKLSSASRAVVVLGMRAVRNLAVCFAVRESLENSGLRSEDLLHFWEDCLRRAVAARLLAPYAQAQPDEAFTAGLLQDFGIIALLRVRRDLIPDWGKLRNFLPKPRRERELAVFGMTHDQVARILAMRWGLPDSLVLALAFHHDVENGEVPSAHRGLARVCSLADTVAAVFTAKDKRIALADAHAALAAAYKLPRESVDALLASISREVDQAAAALGMRVQEQPQFADILREANRSLAEMNMSYEEVTTRLERALVEREEYAAHLQRTLDEKNVITALLEEANARLGVLAFTDALTGLSNRRHFEQLFDAELIRTSASGSPVSLLMIDLDHFKSVNDTHGHAFGDAVLQAVGAVLREVGRASDVKARIGGEELAVILPDTDAATALHIADSIRVGIGARTLVSAKGVVRVSASIGGTTFVGHVARGGHATLIITAMLETADRALYQSKAGGRDRVTWGATDAPLPYA